MEIRNKILGLLVLLFIGSMSYCQGDIIEGYTFEVGNRGYLSMVNISVIDKSNDQILIETNSDIEGYFKLDLPPVSNIVITFSKEMFEAIEKEVELTGVPQFLKIQMERAPGYLFEITLADKKEKDDEVVDAIRGALIEVYNNTTEELVLKLENHPDPEFKLPMVKGNHYTILVRKKGYFAKQMEAYVNVKGCILCFEGINKVRPGVTENLTSGNNYGSLLANVEMDKVFSGKSFDIQNIYYDLNSAALKKESKKELNKVINLLRYNPNLTLELGSHTDARGDDDFNMNLSVRRAKSAVKYITEKGGIPKFRILAAGYGETLLRNECGDGVKCDEAQHQENRRTEIKVIGINEEWVFKPLVNIKNEIKLEKELFESIYGSSKQLSEEEYKKITKLEKEAALPVPVSKPITNKDTLIIEEIYVKKDKTETTKPIDIKEDELPVLIDLEIEEDEMIEPIKSDSDMMDDEVIHPETNLERPSDGYKIIIHFSGVPLDDSNPLFDKHENIEIYMSPEKNYYYMIPGFNSTVAAENAMNEIYIQYYPSAYIAGFKAGRRIL